ncbi:MAG: transposase [Mogibacterium sp.]|nr:transposase [Mogibacterium sp.]
MNTRNLSPEERYELILECRSSGLTDHQWLEEHGIRKSTFYNWISTFREKGYPNIPEPLRQHSRHKPQVQEVVKLSIAPEPVYMDQSVPGPTAGAGIQPVMEIISGKAIIRFSNSVDPHLLETVLQSLGGGI